MKKKMGCDVDWLCNKVCVEIGLCQIMKKKFRMWMKGRYFLKCNNNQKVFQKGCDGG